MAFYCFQLVLFRSEDSVQVISTGCFDVWRIYHPELCARLLVSAVGRVGWWQKHTNVFHKTGVSTKCRYDTSFISLVLVWRRISFFQCLIFLDWSKLKLFFTSHIFLQLRINTSLPSMHYQGLHISCGVSSMPNVLFSAATILFYVFEAIQEFPVLTFLWFEMGKHPRVLQLCRQLCSAVQMIFIYHAEQIFPAVVWLSSFGPWCILWKV